MYLIAYVGTAILVTLFVMGVAAKLAKEKGKNPVKWAGLSFAALFVLAAWDYYPTRWAHQYYCEKEAGFWVYKTLERWKAENPGVMETLTTQRNPPHTFEGDEDNLISTTFWNSRFKSTYKYQGPILLYLWRREDELIDIKNNEVLARYVDFSSSQIRVQAGNPGWKFWLHNEHCPGGQDKAIKYGNFYLQFKGGEK